MPEQKHPSSSSVSSKEEGWGDKKSSSESKEVDHPISHQPALHLPPRSQAEELNQKRRLSGGKSPVVDGSDDDTTLESEHEQQRSSSDISVPPDAEAQQTHSDDIHRLADVGLNILEQRHAATILKYWHNTFQFRDSSIVLAIIDNTKKLEKFEEENVDDDTSENSGEADSPNTKDHKQQEDTEYHNDQADTDDDSKKHEKKKENEAFEERKKQEEAARQKEAEKHAEYRLQHTEPYTIILKSTIFHPEGGGQPADTGVILPFYNEYSEDTKTLTPQYAKDHLEDAFIVTNVRRSHDNSGLVLHHGYFKQCQIKHPEEDHKQHKIDADMILKRSGIREQKAVLLIIDSEKRVLNSRLHTASHVIDLSVENIGYPRETLEPGSGIHAPEESYVEYHGKLSEEDQKTFVERVQKEIDKFVEEKHPVRNHIVPYEELESYCGKGVIPDFIPHSESVRIIGLKGYRHCTCGGTHVDNTEKLGKVTIGKLENIGDDHWRLHYTVEGQQKGSTSSYHDNQ